jgi:hypothetical protein
LQQSEQVEDDQKAKGGSSFSPIAGQLSTLAK